MSRQTIIITAKGEDGTKESPANSNKTKYGVWYGLNGEKWCAIFVSWVYDHAGSPLGFIETAKGYQSCQGGYNHWKTTGQLTNDPQIGDIVLYDWNGDGHCDHTGIFDVWTDAGKTSFFAWEGNTSVSNDSDGGIVMRRQRKRNLVRAFASPAVLGNTSPTVTDNNIKIGDIGTEVTSIQKMLHDLNYTITVDGEFGNKTELVVKQFQTDNQIPATGIVTPEVVGLLEEKSSEPNVADKKFISGSYLRKGDSGSAVLALQKALNTEGAIPQLTADGVFGSDTVAALKMFQKAKSLDVDGIAGPKTFAALGISV